MRLTRIYYQDSINLTDKIILSGTASHHLITVLRIKPADQLIIFNGDGNEYLAEVVELQKKTLGVKIIEKKSPLRESPLSIELAQGISRGDRMDYVIQKAVELGVNAITPLFTERCGVKLTSDRMDRRVAHWRAIIIGACEQSGRLKIPILNEPLTLTEWLELKKEGLKLVCLPEHDSVLKMEKPLSLTLLVGPEGGLSRKEVQQATNSGYHGMQLGPRILRTETAAIVAVTTAQVHWGDMIKC